LGDAKGELSNCTGILANWGGGDGQGDDGQGDDGQGDDFDFDFDFNFDFDFSVRFARLVNSNGSELTHVRS
jgi:hypothetical protein